MLKIFHNFLPILKNKYFIVSTFFIVWLGFFDRTDLLFQYQLHEKLHELKRDKIFFIDEIAKDKQSMYELMNNPQTLEKFAREKYYMKQPNEDVFVILEKSN